jgi:hypothetical protein
MQDELEDLCAWVRQIKGIGQIDLFDLVALIPEYEKWLEDNNGKWAVTHVKCDLCSHKWVAVHPVECERLECSGCGNMTIY